MKKKIVGAEPFFGLLPKLYCEKKKNCIARVWLYCDCKEVQLAWVVLQ